MAQIPAEEITRLSNLHPKPSDLTFQYGTAGFRTIGANLDSVLFRVGVLAALRSKTKDGKTIGVMITASHNPEADNGVKLVDPRGEMLEASWEEYATTLANAPSTQDLIAAIQHLVQILKINLQTPARVLFARDTRPSGPGLVAALEDGLKAIGAETRNEGVQTTPMLHYLVRCVNTKGTPEEYGKDDQASYYVKLASAFNDLVEGKPAAPPLVVDCANGVGAPAAKLLREHLSSNLTLEPVNTAIDTKGVLNYMCGADFVKTTQSLPPSLNLVLKSGQRACSLDGDADRLMYYYLDEKSRFHMLDGDKIAALVANFIVETVEKAGLKNVLKVGVVQTAYANGNSTRYLSKRLPVVCVQTGVKHLHHAAEEFPIGVYFEANGHGTVLFSSEALSTLRNHKTDNSAEATSLKHLVSLSNVINQTVGDALSDMLLVEAILAHKGYTGVEWDASYSDLPNRLVKVVVPDRSVFKTEDAERRLTSPAGLQNKVNDLVGKYDFGRGFVRPSGTEDVVRVYAEAATRVQADELAFKLGGLVYDEVGGDPAKRPKEFL